MSLASLCHDYMLTVICRLPISPLSSLSLQTSVSSVAFCKHQITQQMVGHPGSVRPDEQNSVAECIIHFISKWNKVSKLCHLILCYTCRPKWWHALKQQCREIFSHQRRKRLENAQDIFVKTKTKTCPQRASRPRPWSPGLHQWYPARRVSYGTSKIHAVARESNILSTLLCTTVRKTIYIQPLVRCWIVSTDRCSEASIGMR